MSRMSSIIDDVTFHITGIQAKDSKWEWCQLQNASYPGGVHWKCPSRAEVAHPNMTIALYNPSLVTHRVVAIPIYDANYDVHVFNQNAMHK